MAWGNTVKRIVGIILAAVLVVGLGAFFLVQSAEERVTADMLSRAGRFAIPADWRLTTETIRPERFLCISTNPCPSLYRRWDTGKELSDSDFKALESGLGFTMKTDQPCRRPANGSGTITLCSATGTDGEYHYLLTVTSTAPQEPHLVTLVVVPER